MGAEWNLANPEKCAVASKAYYRRNADAIKANAKQARGNLRAAALRIYGESCACCGEADVAFLTIDHIKPKGKAKSPYERKHLPGWLKSQGYPAGFQTLCWNCNMAKRENSACPHQAKKLELIA